MKLKAALTRSSITVFIATMAALFSLSLIMMSREKDLTTGDGAGPGVFSTSAVGSAGFYDMLRRMDVPVIAATSNPLKLAGRSGVVIVDQPLPAYILSGEGGGVGGAKKMLFVLPKWKWHADAARPEWVSKMTPYEALEAREVLALLLIDASRVVRVKTPEWTVNEFNFSPEIPGIAQLIDPSDEMRTLVGGDSGALLVEIKDDERIVWALSDPDVMANHGIGRGENAAFMTNVVKALSDSGGGAGERRPVVFDETAHGFLAQTDSFMKMLLKFPYAIVTILTAMSSLTLALAAAWRFGEPARERPALDFGKALLIGNSARLLDYGGHHAVTLKNYALMTMNEAARALHAPAGLSGRALAEWLDRVGNSRSVSVTCALILERLESLTIFREGRAKSKDAPELMKTVQAVHRWKGEILNGSGVRRKHR